MRNKILTFLAILCFIGMAAAVYAFTPVEIPSVAAQKIETYTRNKPAAEISIAIITDAGTFYSAYSRDGKLSELPDTEYEIGPVSKTFLGAFLAKEALDGKISLTDRIGSVLPIQQWSYNPMIIDLATHTSAYGSYEPAKFSNLKYSFGKNPYTGITAYNMITEMDDFRLTQQGPFPLSYSDFGVTILGMALAEINGKDYVTLMTDYIQNSLGLTHTYFALDHPVRYGWKWSEGDAYIATAGLTSNLYDMAEYAKMYLGTTRAEMIESTRPLCYVDENLSVGYLWGLTGNGSIVAHTGETAHYASQILIDKEHRVAVVVLSNYCNDRYGNVADIAQAILDETNSIPLQNNAA